MAVEQFWFGDPSLRQFGILRNTDTKKGSKGVLFFPGLAETKAGPVFLFTRIAHVLPTFLPVLQFDYACWGDSEGEMEESSLEGLIESARLAVKVLQQRAGCEEFLFIGHGVGNWIAATIGQWYAKSSLIMLLPYASPFNKDDFLLQTLIEKKDNTPHVLLDTGRSDQWQRGGAMRTLFCKLGADHYTTKGIVIREQLLNDIADIDAKKLLRNHTGSLLEFHPQDQNALAFLAHQQSIALPFEDSYLTNPYNCDFIVEQTCAWIQKECESVL
ncbi:hypothetical protein [Tengunoibacter tsumagoiensis]|uniref:Alpha/beta hydrolase n=1 Tax=Tengunoibacter tsumagoiensis TaxID=2014871 RepID=A0A402A7D1_9CHLR|nr:hypothetical protein [Tengunoibacter tsumagoiensis]GCE14955.1 hypothetical protein KTT_48140 [Tengunoibacter tsumagoiensis]